MGSPERNRTGLAARFLSVDERVRLHNLMRTRLSTARALFKNDAQLSEPATKGTYESQRVHDRLRHSEFLVARERGGHGSATCIKVSTDASGRRIGYFLTNDHVVSDEFSEVVSGIPIPRVRFSTEEQIFIRLPSGDFRAVERMYRVHKPFALDLAILAIPLEPKDEVLPVEIDTRDVELGEQVFVAGYPGYQVDDFSVRSTTVVRAPNDREPGHSWEEAVRNGFGLPLGSAGPGDSGGAVVSMGKDGNVRLRGLVCFNDFEAGMPIPISAKYFDSMAKHPELFIAVGEMLDRVPETRVRLQSVKGGGVKENTVSLKDSFRETLTNMKRMISIYAKDKEKEAEITRDLLESPNIRFTLRHLYREARDIKWYSAEFTKAFPGVTPLWTQEEIAARPQRSK